MQIKYSSQRRKDGQTKRSWKQLPLQFQYISSYFLACFSICCIPLVFTCLYWLHFYVGSIFLFKISKLGWIWYFDAIERELLALLRAILWGRNLLKPFCVGEEWGDCGNKKSFHPSMSLGCQQRVIKLYLT